MMIMTISNSCVGSVNQLWLVDVSSSCIGSVDQLCMVGGCIQLLKWVYVLALLDGDPMQYSKYALRYIL